VIGSLQASEALKLVLGVGRPMIGRLLVFDALETGFRELALTRRTDCPACGDEPTMTGLIDYEQFCGVRQEEEHVTESPQTESPQTESPEFEISVDELKTWRDEGREHVLLDVRTLEEHDIAAIEGSTLMPLHELPERLEELDETADIVVHCHHGPRSSSAVSYLRGHGFPKARNLSGGIDMWSLRIDPTVRQY
jgi:adenylyltransferase/sulfurtransferase